MKRIAFAVCVVVLVLAVAILAQIVVKPKAGSVEQELIKLENEWADAWVKSDVAFHDRIMADDYTWTSPWGWVSTKADDLALVKSGEDVITSWVLTDVKVAFTEMRRWSLAAT